MPIHDHSKDPTIVKLATAWPGAGGIEAQEAAGARQMQGQDTRDWVKFPVDMGSVYRDDPDQTPMLERYEALGFEFHPEDRKVVEKASEVRRTEPWAVAQDRYDQILREGLSDPLFQRVKLPEGWSFGGTGHSMHSGIIDAEGFKRVGIFYKAAFYDRNASAMLVAVPTTAAQDKELNDWYDAIPNWASDEQPWMGDGRERGEDGNVWFCFKPKNFCDAGRVLGEARHVAEVAPDGTIIQPLPEHPRYSEKPPPPPSQPGPRKPRNKWGWADSYGEYGL